MIKLKLKFLNNFYIFMIKFEYKIIQNKNILFLINNYFYNNKYYY